MNVLLWILQVLLGSMFLFAGTLKAFRYEKAKEMLNWVPAVPRPLVAFIGISEIAGGLGLILPGIFGTMTFLVPVAAAGLVLVMVLAIGFHASRNEKQAIGMNLLFLALAGFVAWGRWVVAPL